MSMEKPGCSIAWRRPPWRSLQAWCKRWCSVVSEATLRDIERVEIDRTDLSLPCADRHAELLPLALPPDAATAPRDPGVSLEQRHAPAPHPRLGLYGSTFRVACVPIPWRRRSLDGVVRRCGGCGPRNRSPRADTGEPHHLRMCAPGVARPAWPAESGSWTLTATEP